jgi:prevent-host-death family protein
LESSPDVIPITDFRRDAAGIIGRTVASGRPVYVTQHGRLTAVLVSRTAYEGLLHRLAVLTSVPGGGGVPATTAEAVPDECVGSDRALPERGPRRGAESRAAIADRKALLGPLGRPSESVETRFGLVDFETADFLAVEGFGGGPAEGGAIAHQ